MEVKGVASEYSEADLSFEDSISNREVLKKRVPWEQLCSGGIIDSGSLAFLQRLPSSVSEQEDAIEREGGDYAALFLRLLVNLAHPEYLQYVLAIMDNFLSNKEDRVRFFLQTHQQDRTLPFDPLMNHLRRDGSDWFINAKVSRILGLFLIKAYRFSIDTEKITSYKTSLLNWLVTHARDIESQPKKAAPVLEALRTILRDQESRIIFDELDGIDILGNLIRSPHHPIIYNSMFCLWMMSYNTHLAKHKFHGTLVISRIVDSIKQIHREKITRISVATLKNLSEASKQSSMQIIEAGFIKILPNLLLRKWGDEELEANLVALDELLRVVMTHLGSWDRYKSEIFSGNLEWSLVHKDDRFWRENVSRFSENNFQIVGVLVDLIQRSQNNLVLAVALNDIGRFVRFHPGGRGVVQSLPSAKTGIMQKLDHPDASVQKEALLAIQKLMVSNWEFLPQS